MVMWKKISQLINSGSGSVNILAGGNVNFFAQKIPIEIINERIEEEIENLRKSRLFQEFDCVESSLSLGNMLDDGNLSSGSDAIRSEGLAWCARFLSRSEYLGQAEKYLASAKLLASEDDPEIKIAEAFLFSRKGDKTKALKAISGIGSGASRSASLMIVAHHDGTEEAIQWLNDTGCTTEQLDSDGKAIFLSYQLQHSHWDDATKTATSFTDADFKKTPALHHLTALTYLITAIPPEFRNIVIEQIPFEVAEFRLASNASAMDARRSACMHFLNGAEAAKSLNCFRAEKTSDEYALWLELRDPTQSEHGKNRLKGKLRDLSTALGFVHYAIRFGIELDLDEVEREIDQNIAINGGITVEAAVARFAIAFTKSTAEEAANYIVRHQEQLASHINPKLMWLRLVELYSRAGLIDQANVALDRLVEAGVSGDQKKSLRCIISDAQGSDPVVSRKAQYESTGALLDLMDLVAKLETHQHWNDLCEYGRRLFEQTHELRDAERLVHAFNSTHNSMALVEFLQDKPDFREQSNLLQMSYAWGLYNEGMLLESRQKLAELNNVADSPDYRALQVNLSITMGDWNSLSAYIENEYRDKNDRTAHDLMKAAQLALHIRSLHAKDLISEAASKADADDDATTLAAAYFTATNAGYEGDPEVFQWLERAVVLSGNDGPLQRMSLKDICDRKSAWDHRESETRQLLAQGKRPIFIAAESLNRTLIDLTIFPALANLSEADPRRRKAVPAYSGNCPQQQLDVRGKVVALDASALLTLSFLDVLDVVLDVFGTVLIPHSTLGWLFDEWQRATFHQPSRIDNARQVRDLLATNKLEGFAASTVANSELSAQVGDGLAALIAEAEMVREGDDTQHIVVRSAPVYRPSSLMEEEADLSAHDSVLSSCLAVLEKLKQTGGITTDEASRARIFLQMKERPWTNQPEIKDGATLYLDDLAISYLLHLGFLSKLKDAGLRPIASPRAISEVDALLAYANTSDEVKPIIERIRATLSSRIESGQITVGSMRRLDRKNDSSIPEPSTMGIWALAQNCDVAVVDDRFFNQQKEIGFGENWALTLSTLDLLDALASASVISQEDLLRHRTRLRRAGYFFVPVYEDELKRCLMSSAVVKGEVAEIAELKAIRESVLCVRMSDWLQFPDEASWLDSTLTAFTKVLKCLWQNDANLEEVRVRSSWLLDQVDVRGWAHSITPENADDVVRIGRGGHILHLLAPPIDVHAEIVGAYWNWAEEMILAPVKEQFPELYEWLADWYTNRHREQVHQLTETETSQGDDS